MNRGSGRLRAVGRRYEYKYRRMRGVIEGNGQYSMLR